MVIILVSLPLWLYQDFFSLEDTLSRSFFFFVLHDLCLPITWKFCPRSNAQTLRSFFGPSSCSA